MNAQQTVATVVIPVSSVLHAHTRAGVDAGCSQCSLPIAAHLGHKGVWVGCPSGRIAVDAPMILIVDRRAIERNRRSGDVPAPRRRTTDDTPIVTAEAHTNGSETNGTKPAPRATPQVAPKESWVKYVAKFPLRHDRVKGIRSERDREVYTTLARSRDGLSRLDLLKALHATKRTGIVDGAVRRLRIRYKVIESATV